MNSCSIKLYKIGKFYRANGNDSYIIHELLGYKYVVSSNSVGFPLSALSKVKSKLDDEKISYEIFEKDKLIEKSNGIAKNYKKILKKAIDNMDIEVRINKLREKINSFDEEKLKEILLILENE